MGFVLAGDSIFQYKLRHAKSPQTLVGLKNLFLVLGPLTTVSFKHFGRHQSVTFTSSNGHTAKLRIHRENFGK